MVLEEPLFLLLELPDLGRDRLLGLLDDLDLRLRLGHAVRLDMYSMCTRMHLNAPEGGVPTRHTHEWDGLPHTYARRHGAPTS